MAVVLPAVFSVFMGVAGITGVSSMASSGIRFESMAECNVYMDDYISGSGDMTQETVIDKPDHRVITYKSGFFSRSMVQVKCKELKL